MELYSSCPVCHLSIPIPDIERHVNDHFEEHDIAKDMELAWEIGLAPMTPCHSTVMDDVNFDEELPETWPLRNDVSKEHKDSCGQEEVDCLVRLQRRSKFYHVKDGLMALLGTCLESENRNICSIISRHVDHFQSTRSFDFGWGCGWRNIQMLRSHLISQRSGMRAVLFGGAGFVPDIPSIQLWLEHAWNMGFDNLGANSFGTKIHGSTRWIGATECAALLRSFGLRARIVDFDSKRDGSLKSSCNGHQEKKSRKQVQGPMDKYVKKIDFPEYRTLLQREAEVSKGQSSSDCFHGVDSLLVDNGNSGKSLTKNSGDHHTLVDWVWNYFSSETSCGSSHVSVSNKTPLYFQHDGHSRTIIGIQKQRSPTGTSQQYSLLILDPSQRTIDLERSLIQKKGWQKLLKRGVHTLKKPQYQLCYVDPGIAEGEELERLKFIDSVVEI